MGLPIWTVPSPEPKNAAKHDATAAARSPIRRRFLLSSGPGVPGSPSRLRADPRPSDQQASRILDGIRRRDSRANEPSGSSRDSDARVVRTTPPVPPAPERPYDLRRISDRAYADIQMRVDAIRHFQANRGTDPGRSDSLHSRPLSFGEVESQASITPNFAPAWNGPARLRRQDSIRWDPERDSARSAVVRRYRIRPGRSLDRASPPRSESQDTTDAVRDLPPLRRMGHHRIERRSPSPVVDGTTDGLGDRERSLSSEVDSAWDTMLTTITPDTHMPSADSSFTSAVASASFSAPDPSQGRRSGRGTSSSSTSSIPSARSSATHLTVPSQEDLNRLDCDTSEASGSETEADVGPSRLRSRRERRPENRALRSESPGQDSRPHRRRSGRDGPPTLTYDQWRARREQRRPRDILNFLPTGNWRVVPDVEISSHDDSMSRAMQDAESNMEEAERNIDHTVSQREREALSRFFARFGASDSEENLMDDEFSFRRSAQDGFRREMEQSAEAHTERDESAEGLMEGLITGASGSGSAEDRELELFRPILERLASRQDIPDAFWMSAGLTRVMTQRGEDERR